MSERVGGLAGIAGMGSLALLAGGAKAMIVVAKQTQRRSTLKFCKIR
jgi:acyl CoA:acetate/3-ketoacid CoA transferase beta subunit